MNDGGWSITHQNNDVGNYIYLTGSFEGSADFDPGANDNTLISFGGTDIFVGCFDTNGNQMGAFNYGGPNGDAGYSIDADQTELVWLTGVGGNLKTSSGNSLSNTISKDIDIQIPLVHKKQYFETGEEIIWEALLSFVTSDWGHLSVLGEDPRILHARLSTEQGVGNGISGHNPVYLIGEYTGTIDLDASDNTASFTSNGQADFFIAKYSQNPLAVEEYSNIPESFSLEQNYPNPFNPTTTIEYNVTHASHVTIEIFDLNGKLINRIVNSFKRTGTYAFNWGGKDYNNESVSSGTYIYRLRSNGEELAKKMILLR